MNWRKHVTGAGYDWHRGGCDGPAAVTPRQALAHAIDLFGHVRCLAWSLGVPCREVEQWSEVPADHVERCAAITGISREVLRPDEILLAQPDLFASAP